MTGYYCKATQYSKQMKQIMSGMIMLAINMETYDYNLKTTAPWKSVGNSVYLIL